MTTQTDHLWTEGLLADQTPHTAFPPDANRQDGETHHPDRLEPDGDLRSSSGSRIGFLLGALFWISVFGWLWLTAPTVGRAAGAAWFTLGAAHPFSWFVSLALALPWFGNNPGGAHHLYLLDMGAMGLVAGHLARRALGRAAILPMRLDGWIWLLVACGWVSLIMQFHYLRCEWLLHRFRFIWMIYNHYGTAPVYGLRAALDLTLAAGIYGVLRDRPFTARQLRLFAWVLFAALAGSAVLGLLEYARLIRLDWWRGENPTLAVFGFRRLQSLFWHPGWYAQYLAALAPAVLAIAVVLGRKTQPGAAVPQDRTVGAAVPQDWAAGAAGPPSGSIKSRIAPAACFALAGLLTLTMFLTHQRAGWVALAAGFGIVIAAATLADKGVNYKKLLGRLGIVYGLLALLAILLIVFVPSFRNRVGELFAYSHRTRIWGWALDVIRRYPLAGAGLGNFYTAQMEIHGLAHPFFAMQIVGAHNLYLQVWAERGLAGLGLMLAIIGTVLARAWRALRAAGQSNRAEGGLLALAILGGFGALLVNGLFQEVLYVREIELIFWVMVGMSGWLAAPEGKAAKTCGGLANGRAVRHWHTPVTLLLLAFIYGIGMWHENPNRIKAWDFIIDGVNMDVGGQEVRLRLPEGARRVIVPLGTLDPTAAATPVEMTLSLEGRELQRVSFAKPSMRRVMVDLPETRDPGARLHVHASRTYSPYVEWRYMPIMNAGVLWLHPEAAD